MADPSLINAAGHCARYLRSVADALAKVGLENHLIGNLGIMTDRVHATLVRPFFALACDDARSSNADFALARGPSDQWRRHSISIVEGLEAMDQEFGLRDADVVLLNTLRQWSLPGIVEWLEARPRSACPKIAIVLHYSSQRTRHEADATTAEYERALGRIATSNRRSCIMLFADSEELAAEFAALSSLACRVVPIPHVGDIKRITRQGSEIRVVAAGPARANKGFDLLPSVLTALQQSNREGRLVVQGFSFHHGPRLARTITALRRGNATLLPDELSDKEFRNLLATADLIVLPYRTEYYHSQTSGVFAEALGAGIPVVVPADTWMARQVAEFGGGITFDSATSEGFETACRQAIDEIDRLTMEAHCARDRWLETHGPRQFLNVVEDALAADLNERATPDGPVSAMIA